MNIPKELFKYRDFDKYTMLNLINNSVWLPSPASLNDPFDAQLQLSEFGVNRKDLRTVIDSFLCSNPHVRMNVGMLFVDEDKVSDIYKREVKKFIEDETLFSKKMGIFSLSETSENSVMWSHYSNNHVGICIGYHSDKLKEVNVFKDGYQDKVDYATEDNISRDAYEVAANLGFYVDSHFDVKRVFALYLKKSKDWSYEKEWRYLVRYCNQQNVKIQKDTISSITFGLRTPDSTKEAVVKILRENTDVKYYQIERKPNVIGINRVLMQMDL